MRKRSRGFQLQLLGIVFLPFAVVIAAIASIAVVLHAESIRRIVGERDERACVVTAGRMSQILIRTRGDLLTVAVHLGEGETPVQALAFQGEEAPDQRARIAVLDGEGRLVAGNMPAWVSPQAVLSDLSSVQMGGFSYSGVTPRDGPSYAVVRYSRRGFVLVAFLPIEEIMRSAIPNLPTEDRIEVFIVDGSSRVLADFGSLVPDASLARHVGVQEALKGLSGVTYVPGSGDEHVVAFSAIQPTGWALVVEEPWQSAVNPLLRFHLAAPLSLAPALLIALLAAWLGASRVVGPLRALRSQAGRIARGDYASAGEPVNGVAEINYLQKSLVDLADRVQAGQHTLRGYIARVTHAHEEERWRLARDLHDETIQDLIVLDQKVQVLAADAEARGLPEAHDLKDLHREAQEQIVKVRRLTRALRPASLDELGIMPALLALVRDVEKDIGIPIQFRCNGEGGELSPEESLSVYRIVQEALTNIGRHAGARHAWVEVDASDDALDIRVRDDGRGFSVPEDTGELSRNGHYGIIGMFERALLLNGTLEVTANTGHGTHITLHLPLRQPH